MTLVATLKRGCETLGRDSEDIGKQIRNPWTSKCDKQNHKFDKPTSKLQKPTLEIPYNSRKSLSCCNGLAPFFYRGWEFWYLPSLVDKGKSAWSSTKVGVSDIFLPSWTIQAKLKFHGGGNFDIFLPFWALQCNLKISRGRPELRKQNCAIQVAQSDQRVAQSKLRNPEKFRNLTFFIWGTPFFFFGVKTHLPV